MNNVEFFKENGYVVLEKAISDDLIDRYIDSWNKEHSNNFDQHGNNFGWSMESGNDPHEYLNHPEVMDIMCHSSINQFFIDLELPVALHRVDTWGTTSQKPWHQDSMLSNPIAYNNYIGAWVAAEDVTMEAGPFQLIAKSHKWKFDKQAVYMGKDQEIVNGRGKTHVLQKKLNRTTITNILLSSPKKEMF
jgi:ectoine hydroxylase-related dioxygenase (phytanoyl-CoA dioxygenase family)